MPPTHENDYELFALFDRALVGLATEEDVNQLEACLKECAEYRTTYRNIATLHSDLVGAARRSRARQAIYDEIRDRAAGQAVAPEPRNAEPMPAPLGLSESSLDRPKRQSFIKIHGIGWLMVAASIPMAIFLADSLRQPEPLPMNQLFQKKLATTEPEADIVAFLTRADEVVWREEAKNYSVNAVLHNGEEIWTESGELELEFVGGARVTLSGNSRFALEGELHGTLYSGRLSANVPPRASGFTVGYAAISRN